MSMLFKGIFAAVGAFALVAGTAQAETLRASHQWNTNDVRHKMVEIIKTEVEKADVGLNVRIYPSASLYKPKEQYAPLTTGQLDISAFPLAYAADRHPQFDATLMPGLVKNHDHAKRLNDSEFMQEIKQIINDSGVIVLADTWLAGGFASKENCILEPEDIEGQVSRAAGKAFEQMLVGAGASIASMPSSEIYTAMQTGVLDAANTSSGSFVSYRIYEQVKCLTAPGDHALWFMYEPILMSKKSFDALTEEQQEALMAAGQVSEEYFFEQAKKLDKTMVDTFKEAGVEVVTMNAEQAQMWRDIAQETSYAEFAKNVEGGQELIDKALAVE
ncbi:TRAP-type C4-dicarboxylate transport system substrate-binding protein [Dichotomicrobium thermohalophilum]|uniref:TRAP-type C4-dicarboxylate transport system substrate-binding protein n=2 Tax=Dichotomicrobium thermohalophilum TaxID=933063 RepID=A0A397PF07_9HYPH|nr:TRAP-type C4-dicarboxylate transport system substrate-binding protein [Dichotomicrobium thermohalophilum]